MGTSAFLSRLWRMKNIHFPVVSVGNPKMPRHITSMTEAAAFLLNDWPAARGPKHARARIACVDAIEGRLSGYKARAFFIDAAKEAHIFLSAAAWFFPNTDR
jgi:Protein of unknown function (DUF982)|nr:DUF982 domain-containing protein [Phyllobacterium calauticae]